MATTPIGRKIRALREAAGLSRDELARKANMTASAVYNIEAGISKEPTFATRQALSLVLGVTPRELAGEVEPDAGEAERIRAYSAHRRLKELGIEPCELADLFESMAAVERGMVLELARHFGGK